MKLITLQYSGFEWNDGNIKKAQKHHLSIEDIENFFQQDVFLLKDEKHSHQEERFIAVGNSKKGRALFIVYTLKHYAEQTLVRVISARYAHEKEARQYEILKSKDKKNSKH